MVQKTALIMIIHTTVVYETEDITLKEETLDFIPDDLNASRVGNVNETVIIPEKSFDDITDDPNVQNSNDRGSLAITGKILENTQENPTPKKVVVIPLLRSKKQVSAKKERSKKILKVSYLISKCSFSVLVLAKIPTFF